VALDDPEVIVVDGRPEYHVAGCSRLAGLDAEPIPLSQAVEDGFTPCPLCTPADGPDSGSDPAVWVVDGSPEYHEEGCTRLSGRDAEPIPLTQAVEDGFVRCAVCAPPAAGATAEPAAASEPPATAERQVWVVDGKPDYHRAECAQLAGEDAEPIPRAQAVEDGFAPCALCAPDAPAPATPESPPSPPEVWVADGFPDYHSAGCHELNGLESEAIPHEQAVEDGFTPCPVCQPDRTAASVAEPAAPSGAAAADVWVVDGSPEYHRAGCVVLAGLDAEPIPLTQAVEDGFAPCTVCAPEAAQAPSAPEPEPAPAPPPESATVVESEPEPAGEAADPDVSTVWVADGYPDYHRAGCRELDGLDAEPIPFDQAVEDDFQPCEVCRPRLGTAPAESLPAPEQAAAEPEPAVAGEPDPEPEPLAEAAPKPEAEPATASAAGSGEGRRVWVVHGRPRYHSQDCLIIKGQQAQPIPFDEAVEHGFVPCSLCQRDG
jgi:hypothetical protein